MAKNLVNAVATGVIDDAGSKTVRKMKRFQPFQKKTKLPVIHGEVGDTSFKCSFSTQVASAFQDLKLGRMLIKNVDKNKDLNAKHDGPVDLSGLEEQLFLSVAEEV